MKVNGFEVTDIMQAALVAKMKDGPFKSSTLMMEAMTYGAPSEDTAHRIADRMIQKHRKSLMMATYPIWEWRFR